MEKVTFLSNSVNFCNDCGSILPLVSIKGNIVCYLCSKEYNPNVFGQNAMKYTIHFNSAKNKISAERKEAESSGESKDGPVVLRRCPMCDSDKMSYATLQLRSADEGQTVFYTCVKCKYKETENS